MAASFCKHAAASSCLTCSQPSSHPTCQARHPGVEIYAPGSGCDPFAAQLALQGAGPLQPAQGSTSHGVVRMRLVFKWHWCACCAGHECAVQPPAAAAAALTQSAAQHTAGGLGHDPSGVQQPPLGCPPSGWACTLQPSAPVEERPAGQQVERSMQLEPELEGGSCGAAACSLRALLRLAAQTSAPDAAHRDWQQAAVIILPPQRWLC